MTYITRIANKRILAKYFLYSLQINYLHWKLSASRSIFSCCCHNCHRYKSDSKHHFLSKQSIIIIIIINDYLMSTNYNILPPLTTCNHVCQPGIKDALANVTLLFHPVLNAPTSLMTDASDLAIGAVLQQLVDGHLATAIVFL